VFSAVALVVGVAALSGPASVAQLQQPYRVLVEPSGSLLVADGESGRIVRVDPRTGARKIFARGLGRVYDLAYGPRGNLYAASGSRIIRFSATGRKRVVARGLHYPSGVAVASNGTLYVVETGRNRVLRFARTGKRNLVAAKGLDQPLGIALAVDGRVYVADSHHGRVVRIRPGQRLEPVVKGLELPVSITAEPDRSLVIVDHVRHDQPGKILRRLPDGTLRTLSAGEITGVSSADIAPDGSAYATTFLPPFLGRLDAAGRLVPLSG
jgi:sugar lactone lactonase YvrE